MANAKGLCTLDRKINTYLCQIPQKKKKKNQSAASENHLTYSMKIELGIMCYDQSRLSDSLNLAFREIYLRGGKHLVKVVAWLSQGEEQNKR